jgi:hypothetical protein
VTEKEQNHFHGDPWKALAWLKADFDDTPSEYGLDEEEVSCLGEIHDMLKQRCAHYTKNAENPLIGCPGFNDVELQVLEEDAREEMREEMREENDGQAPGA